MPWPVEKQQRDGGLSDWLRCMVPSVLRKLCLDGARANSDANDIYS